MKGGRRYQEINYTKWILMEDFILTHIDKDILRCTVHYNGETQKKKGGITLIH